MLEHARFTCFCFLTFNILILITFGHIVLPYRSCFDSSMAAVQDQRINITLSCALILKNLVKIYSYRVCKYVTRFLEIVYPEMVYTDHVKNKNLTLQCFAAMVFDRTAFGWRNMELRIAISGSYLVRDLQTLYTNIHIPFRYTTTI